MSELDFGELGLDGQPIQGQPFEGGHAQFVQEQAQQMQIEPFTEAERDRVLINIEEHSDQESRFEALRLEYGRAYHTNPDCPPGYKGYCDRKAAEQIAAKQVKRYQANHEFREPIVDAEMRDDSPMPIPRAGTVGTPASFISNFSVPATRNAQVHQAGTRGRGQHSRSNDDETSIRLDGDLVRDGFRAIIQIATGKSGGRGKPYERRHGHGSRNDQAKEVQEQIAKYLEGGEYPRLQGWQWKRLSPEDDLKIAEEKVRRARAEKP